MTRPLRLALLPAAALLSGCGILGAGDNPFQLAYRAGAGYWPENSRIAVDNSLAYLYDGLQVDVVVTADEVPVLHRSAALAPEVCVMTSMAELTEGEVVIGQLTFDELEKGYYCGGFQNPDYEDAAIVQDTITPMSYMMESIAAHNDGALVMLRVVYEEGVTVDAETTARAVLETWFATDPGNRLILAADSKAMLDALYAHAAAIGKTGQFTTTLVWPDDPGFGSSVAADLSQVLGLADPVAQAAAAGSDGVLLSSHVADRTMARKLGANGFDVQVWQADGTSREKAFDRWPIEAVLSAYPDPEPNQ